MFSLMHIPYTFLLLIPISSGLAQGLRSEANVAAEAIILLDVGNQVHGFLVVDGATGIPDLTVTQIFILSDVSDLSAGLVTAANII
jgi:Ca2+/Na+ antiporter